MIDRDKSDLVFRLLFSLIFLLLGLEHLFDDHLIQAMMPTWLPAPGLLSKLAGVILLGGGLSVALGYYMRTAAYVLGGFLLTVTLIIHLPGLLHPPSDLPADWRWLWDVYQKSNIVKNLCLLGVCFHLLVHQPGRHSLAHRTHKKPATTSH